MKAVIPAAGRGTRFLPATKAQPKEMLPVVDKPVIQYVVEEAVEAGIDDIIIITGRGKRAIEDHFDYSYELENILKERGRDDYLESIRRLRDRVDIFYIRQREQKGLGDAILCAKKHIGDEPFVVMLGDDIIINSKPGILQLIEVFKRMKGSVISLERVSRDKVSSYGIIDGERVEERLYLIKDFIEKPSIEKAPSNLASAGRYVLMPEIFECLERTEPGVGNEIQITDAIRMLSETQDVYGYEFEGKRYDIGDKTQWIKATLELALEREELREELVEWLNGLKI